MEVSERLQSVPTGHSLPVLVQMPRCGSGMLRMAVLSETVKGFLQGYGVLRSRRTGKHFFPGAGMELSGAGASLMVVSLKQPTATPAISPVALSHQRVLHLQPEAMI